MMISFTLLETDDLTREEVEDLWKQGVDLDDWDYMLVFDDLLKFNRQSNCTELPDPNFVESISYAPKSYSAERLLTGCCDNRWYKVIFRGGPRMIGIAYHA
jgi:hypothetical protein